MSAIRPPLSMVPTFFGLAWSSIPARFCATSVMPTVAVPSASTRTQVFSVTL